MFNKLFLKPVFKKAGKPPGKLLGIVLLTAFAVGSAIANPAATKSVANEKSAQTKSAAAPIRINADHWQADQKTGVSVYTGAVIITQDNVRISADEARIKLTDGVLQFITITGSPATFTQTPTDAPPLKGQARRVEYNAISETATLTGKAHLNQGTDDIRAASIFIDINAEKVIAQSDAITPERVRVILTPKNKKN